MRKLHLENYMTTMYTMLYFPPNMVAVLKSEKSKNNHRLRNNYYNYIYEQIPWRAYHFVHSNCNTF